MDGLLNGLRGVVVLLLVVVVLLVLGGGDCGWEGGDVGLEVGQLARLGWWGLVNGVCFAGRGVSVVVVVFESGGRGLRGPTVSLGTFRWRKGWSSMAGVACHARIEDRSSCRATFVSLAFCRSMVRITEHTFCPSGPSLTPHTAAPQTLQCLQCQ